MIDRCDVLCLDAPLAEAIRAGLPDAGEAERLSDLAAGVADPTRLLIARALQAAPELCVCDIAWILGRAQNAVSHHLRIMRSNGLLQSRRDGKFVMYGLTPAGMTVVAALGADEVSA